MVDPPLLPLPVLLPLPRLSILYNHRKQSALGADAHGTSPGNSKGCNSFVSRSRQSTQISPMLTLTFPLSDPLGALTAPEEEEEEADADVDVDGNVAVDSNVGANANDACICAVRHITSAELTYDSSFLR